MWKMDLPQFPGWPRVDGESPIMRQLVSGKVHFGETYRIVAEFCV